MRVIRNMRDIRNIKVIRNIRVIRVMRTVNNNLSDASNGKNYSYVFCDLFNILRSPSSKSKLVQKMVCTFMVCSWRALVTIPLQVRFYEVV